MQTLPKAFADDARMYGISMSLGIAPAYNTNETCFHFPTARESLVRLICGTPKLRVKATICISPSRSPIAPHYRYSVSSRLRRTNLPLSPLAEPNVSGITFKQASVFWTISCTVDSSISARHTACDSEIRIEGIRNRHPLPNPQSRRLRGSRVRHLMSMFPASRETFCNDLQTCVAA